MYLSILVESALTMVACRPLIHFSTVLQWPVEGALLWRGLHVDGVRKESSVRSVCDLSFLEGLSGIVGEADLFLLSGDVGAVDLAL